jgi:hypothetical protein
MFDGVVVAKGLNVEQRAKVLRDHWESMDDPVAIVLDVSRFDQHVSFEALCWEHQVYQWFFPGDKDLEWHLDRMRNNFGYARTRDGLVKYKLRGKRMSGDMSTSLGNVLLMIAVLTTFLRRATPPKTWRIFDDGDDCVLLLERKMLKRVITQLPGWYKRMGFKLKIEQTTDVFEQIVFCQTSPVWARDRWVMVRHPARALEKDLIQVKMFQTQKQWRAKMVAVAGCGLALAGDMPIYHQFYSTLACFGAEKNVELTTGSDYLAIGLEVHHHQPTPETRASFYRAFGIPPDQQIALEGYYESVQPEWCAPVPVEQARGKVITSLVEVHGS